MTITELFGGRCKIYQGHVLETLRQLPDNSVHTCVTSPPYFGLRQYSTDPQVWDADPNCQHEWVGFKKRGITGGKKSEKVQIKGSENFQIVDDSQQATCSLCGAWRGELGAEPTPEMYVKHMVEVFREVRRAMHSSATLWLNIGDSYAANRSYQVGSTKGGKKHSPAQGGQTGNRVPNGMKPKDLMGIPWMLAFALRADGWHLRSEIIWWKPNQMPFSGKDRPTRDFEHIFLLSKSGRYYFDGEAVAEPKAISTIKDKRTNSNGHRRNRGFPGAQSNGGTNLGGSSVKRNIRCVWKINTRSYKGAHFAVYPPALVVPCVKSGSSEKGVCHKCAAPWVRIVKKSSKSRTFAGNGLGVDERKANNNGGSGGYVSSQTLGWKPTCDCDAGYPVPATVLDPFHGSGTTSVVALNHGRNAIGCELNPEYVQLSIQRIQKEVTGQLELGV